MRRSQRLIAAAVLIALSGALAGCCGGFDSNWDPTDMLDFLDTKKKLPGERKPVFPEGVPGLEQGVPKELYKGSAQEQIDQQNAAGGGRRRRPPPAAEVETQRKIQGQAPPAAASWTRRTPTRQPRKRAAPPRRRRAPKPKKIVRKRTTAPPPDQPAAQPAPSGQPAQPPIARNNPPRHSRRRCRAAPSRADLRFSSRLTCATLP